jgi:SAM-dependent methyltransferase
VNLLPRVQQARRALDRSGPPRTRDVDGDDFARVTLPAADCDALRDLLIAEEATTVVEIGLAYARSALAIGEALVSADRGDSVHIVIDPYQESIYHHAGWDTLRAAGLDRICELVPEQSQLVLPRMVVDGFTADAAFVDGSHHFHSLFVDLYFLWRIVRPGGVVVLDDHWSAPVAAVARYYESNLGWRAVPGPFDGATTDPATGLPRVRALRLPDPPIEPPYTAFQPF